MEEPDLLKRVSDLEQEVKTLKASANAEAEKSSLAARCQQLAQVLIANWVLLSFISALLVAGYVKYKFGIDYFESYRNASTTKDLSRFYERLGDRMMGRGEWKAADQNYSAALKMNANNADATYGMVKAEVFQPLPGEKYAAPEVIDATLEYLSSRFPNDYQIDYLRAVRYQSMGKIDEERLWLQKCIDKEPEFAGCYFQLGYLDESHSMIKEARSNYAKAVEHDSSFAAAKNNLAACNILLSDFSGATREFEESYQISPSAVTALSLGEAYWYSRKFDAALYIHQIAANYMNENHDSPDRYIGGEWTAGFLPLHAGDLETIKMSVPLYTVEQKKALLHFELSIDHALLGELGDADREFDIGLKLQPPAGHRQLVQNRIQSVENMVLMPDGSREWLARHRQKLDEK
jgi:tetratricopeptide (TPR) repeat protein